MASSSIHTYSNDEKVWFVKNLWKESNNLPIKRMRPEEVANLDEISSEIWWEELPTMEDLVLDLQRVLAADLRFPIILSAEGNIMDGMHRLVKAALLDKTVLVRQFEITPEPDYYDFELDS